MTARAVLAGEGRQAQRIEIERISKAKDKRGEVGIGNILTTRRNMG